MSVEAFTVDGKVTLDITPFESAIGKLTSKLTELQDGLGKLGIHTQSFTNELGVADKQFDDLKGSVSSTDSEMTNMINRIGEATGGVSNLNNELTVANEKVSALKNETSTLVYDFGQFTTEISNAVNQAQALNNEFSSMRYYLDLAKVESEALLQIEKEKESLIHKNKMDALTNRQTLISEADERNRIQLMEVEKELQQEMVRRLEREAQVRRNLRQETIQGYQMGLRYLEQQHEAETLLYDDIIKRYETQGKLATTVQEQLGLLSERNAKDEQDLAFLEEQLVLQKSINTLVAQGGAENIKQAEALMKQLESDTEVYAILQEQIALEREKLGILEEQDAIIKKQVADREKEVAMSGKGAKGNQLDKMGYLPSRIGSMAVTMWGFNEIMDIYEKSMANINAQGQMKTYTDLMKTDNRYLTQTKQNVNDITTGLNDLNKSLYQTYKGGDSLQKMYQKVDMTQVGANAMDTAFKYGVQAENLDDLTEVMAIYGSEFVRQGRSQEDSILAVNDALDGELRRLKEVGIDKEDLEAKGWDGTTETMITALREIAEERGYDVIAQKITNLSDAITVLEIRIAQDLVGAFKTVEPVLVEVAKDFMLILDAMEWVFTKLKDGWNYLGKELSNTFGADKVKQLSGGLLKVVGVAITLGITFGVVYKVVKALRGVLSSVFSIFGKGTDEIAKTTGDIAKTGGTVAKDSGGGFKENFKNQWSKLGKDLGKMARAFVVVAVGMGMAFALIEEGILLISGIGATYDALKPQFNQGIDFIKEFGLWFALLGGAMLVLSYAIGQIPQGVEKAVTKGATRLAYGMAIAMGLITEAIALLIAPMTAIALLGGTASFLGTNLDKGLEVITWIGNALHQIDLPIALFIGGFLAISLLLGVVQPLTLALGVGIASALLLVTEAIVMLIPPLGAIALLGGTASMLGEENINQGAETIKMIGRVLQVLAEAIPYLLVVDIGVFAVQLVEWGNRLLSGGKDGLTTLVQDILPTIQTFITDFNQLDFSETLKTEKITTITTVASQLPPLFTAIQNLNNAMGTSDAVGNVFGAVGGSISGAIGMGLKGKLDQLYNDVKDVMDFATKLGGLSSTGGANASAVTQTANAIIQLKAKLTLLVSTITGASAKVKSASKTLGTGLKTGFTEGSSGFNTSVVSILAKGISEVQSRYNTWHSGGKTSAQKLTDGFKTFGGKIKSTISTEMDYALDKLDEYKDDFYNKGKALGEELTRGYQDGADIHSPGLIARTTARELRYTMDALNVGEQMMYRGGVALGQALTNGYNSGGNLRTNVDMLASKGVNNQQLQANARNVQVNAKKNQQVPQSLNPTINIDMSNSTVIGVQDLDEKIRSAVEKAIIKINSPSGAIGY